MPKSSPESILGSIWGPLGPPGGWFAAGPDPLLVHVFPQGASGVDLGASGVDLGASGDGFELIFE